MGSLKIVFKAESFGNPVLDGTAHDAVLDWIDETKKQAGEFAVRQLRSVPMNKTGRATGRYQAGIRTSLLRFNDVLVDDPVVYGPWLEGTSERNRSTRFKGYHLWRLARQATQEAIGGIAEEVLPQFAERIGITR